jgi:plasmid stability protein
MLGTPDPVRDTQDAIYQQLKINELSRDAAIERFRESDPHSVLASILAADQSFEAGDIEAAAASLFDALTQAPAMAGTWMRLAALQEEVGGDGRPYILLALWQIISAGEVADEVAAAFDQLGDAARSIDSYAALASQAEASLGNAPWPEPLIPFRLLRRVQLDAHKGLDPDPLADILNRFDTCAPLFRNALRQWADDDRALSDPAVSILLAILGERGGPEFIDDIFPDEQYPTTEVLRHAQWAVWRLGQRFPEAAFASLQAFAGAADLTARGLLAEQFYFLPPAIAGRREAILHLLDNFSPGDDPDEAGYLLLTVSTLMAMLGSPADARAVLEKHHRSLPKETREWLNESMGGEEPFLPLLAAAGVDELTLEHVAIDSALLDEIEDDELDDDEEYEDDYDEPVIAEPKPGRNDPCWCGSGKKYKKCHLAEDDEAARKAASTDTALFHRVLDDIMTAAVGKMNRADAGAAHNLFFECDPGMIELDDDAQTAFFQWMVLDFRAPSTGRTAIEEYLRRRGGRLPEDERALVDAFRNARYSLWEIQRVDRGRGIEVKDYFAGDTLFISDVTSSREAAQWDCLIGYLYQRDGRWELFSDGLRVPRLQLAKVVEVVESGARDVKLPPADYFRSHSHEWGRVVTRIATEWLDGVEVTNAEGDALEFCEAVYEVTEPVAVEAALLAAGMFEADESDNLVWLETPGATEGRVFGYIAIADGRLRLESNSRKRLAIGRQLVEKHGGQRVRHVADNFNLPIPEQPELPPEEHRRLALMVKSTHYATWPDIPVPALGGKTPREAVRSETGRHAVDRLLRDFENTEEHERLKGEPAFDFGPLRKELGLNQ